MTSKERMLRMVLEDKSLQELYNYKAGDYEDLYDAYNSDNIVVATIARIIYELNGSTDLSDQKKVYKSIFNYLLNNILL